MKHYQILLLWRDGRVGWIELPICPSELRIPVSTPVMRWFGLGEPVPWPVVPRWRQFHVAEFRKLPPAWDYNPAADKEHIRFYEEVALRSGGQSQ